MDASSLTELLYCFCVLSVLLLIGALLRAVVPLFRKLFLPASVIGGFIGLLVGPIVWGGTRGIHIPFPDSWIETWAALPGILIIPVVACVPLGMKLKTKKEKKAGKTSSNVIKMFAIISAATVFQGVIGMLTQTVFNQLGYDLYPTFGYELPSGFSGGHGTAGVIGNYYLEKGLDYWKTAQGVTTTTATFGLIGGMIIGIVAINIAARKGKTALLKKPGDIPEDVAKGYQMDKEKQKSLGRETTMNSSIETLSFHLAVVLTGCGLAYGVIAIISALKLTFLTYIPIWAYAILVMFGVNYVLQKLNMGTLIDSKTKSRIAGTCSDFAITAAIASLPLQAVMTYIVPIITMVVLGFVCTYVMVSFLCNKYFDDYKVERSMACLGTCTGVFLTGLMLLRLCDPDYKTPVLNDYSVGYSMTSIVSFILLAVLVGLMLTYSSLINAAIQFGIFIFFIVLLLIAHKASGGTKQKA